MTARAKFVLFIIILLALLVLVLVFGSQKGDIRFENLNVSIPDSNSVVTLDRENTGADNNFQMGVFESSDGVVRGSVVILEDQTVETSTRLYVPFAVNYGGSGEFIYIGLFEKTVDGLRHKSSYKLGDRIDVRSIEVLQENEIRVVYNGHKEGQALAENPQEETEVVIAIVNDAFVIPQLEEPGIGSSDDMSSGAIYGIAQMRDKVISQIGQPIEGFEPSMFMDVYPGINPEDFDGVEALQGVYREADGVVQFEEEDTTLVHSAAQAISDAGMVTLLLNISTRLDMSLLNEEDIDALLGAISSAEQDAEETE